MPARNQQAKAARWSTLPVIAIIAGIGLVLLSLVWPSRSLSRATWTQAQAEQYQAASVKLHNLSHGSVHATAEALATHQRELAQVEVEYKSIRADLDSAIDRPKNHVTIMRFVGAILLVVGAIGTFASRHHTKA